jgi:hypothetical protein
MMLSTNMAESIASTSSKALRSLSRLATCFFFVLHRKQLPSKFRPSLTLIRNSRTIGTPMMPSGLADTQLSLFCTSSRLGKWMVKTLMAVKSHARLRAEAGAWAAAVAVGGEQHTKNGSFFVHLKTSILIFWSSLYSGLYRAAPRGGRGGGHRLEAEGTFSIEEMCCACVVCV